MTSGFKQLKALRFALLALYATIAMLPAGYMLNQNADGDISIAVCQSNPLSEFGHKGHNHNNSDAEDYREKCGFGALTSLAQIKAEVDLPQPSFGLVKNSAFPIENDRFANTVSALPLGARAPPVA
ncbi:MAG: hypothetical protein PVF65_11590 [Sphingomonadales bacterium]|jgi:hypothetical protein